MKVHGMLATQSSSCSFKSIVAGFPLPNSMFAALFILFLLLLLALLFKYSLGLLDAQGELPAILVLCRWGWEVRRVEVYEIAF